MATSITSALSQMGTFELAQKEAPLTCLPFECIMHTLSHLDGKNIIRLSNVCKLFMKISRIEMLWTVVFQREFPAYSLKPSSSSYEQYKAGFLTRRNWRTGQYRFQEYLSKMQVFDILDFKNSRLIYECYTESSVLHISELSENQERSIQFGAVDFGRFHLLENQGLALVYCTMGLGGFVAICDWESKKVLSEAPSGGHFVFDDQIPVVSDPMRNTTCIHNLRTGTLMHPLQYLEPKLLEGQYLILSSGSELHLIDKATGTPLDLYSPSEPAEIIECFSHKNGLLVIYKNSTIKELNCNGSFTLRENWACCELTRLVEHANIDNDYLFVTYYDKPQEKSFLRCFDRETKSFLYEKNIERPIYLNLLSDELMVFMHKYEYTILEKKTGEKRFSIQRTDRRDIVNIIELEYYLICYSIEEGDIRVIDKKQGHLLGVIENATRPKIIDNHLFYIKNKTVRICDFNENSPFENSGQLPLDKNFI